MSITEDPETNAKMLEDFIAAWNARDLDRAIDMMTEDVVWEDASMPAAVQGKDAVRSYVNAVLSAFPDFQVSLRGPVCVSLDGTTCALPLRIKATHLHPLVPPGYGPTNRAASFDQVDYVQIRDNRVAHVQTYADMVTVASQLLGVQLKPRPGSFRERLLVVSQRMIAAVVRCFAPKN